MKCSESKKYVLKICVAVHLLTVVSASKNLLPGQQLYQLYIGAADKLVAN